jgi:RHS repeat-associated protein
MNVNNKGEGGNIITEYDIQWTIPKDTVKEQVSQITPYGIGGVSGGKKLPPTTFEYYDQKTNYSTSGVYYDIPGDDRALRQGVNREVNLGFGKIDDNDIVSDFYDMNGDGLIDRIYKDNSSQVEVWLNTGKNFVKTAAPWVLYDNKNLRDNNIAVVSTFFDRAVDSFFEHYDGTWYRDRIGNISVDGSWRASAGICPDIFTPNKFPNYISYKQADFSDVNGDGRADRIVFEKNGSNDFIKIYLNNGNGFNAAPMSIQVDSPGLGTVSFPEYRDKIDWATMSWTESEFVSGYEEKWDYNTNKYEWVRSSFSVSVPNRCNRTYYTYEVNKDQYDRYNYDLIDMTGDGFMDYVKISHGKLEIYDMSTGVLAKVDYGDLSLGELRGSLKGDTMKDMFDINGDGLTDIVLKKPGSNSDIISVFYNTGSSFIEEKNYTKTDTLSLRDIDDGRNHNRSTACDYIDYNGDGYPDRIVKDYSNDVNTALEVWLNGGYKDFVKITDSNKFDRNGIRVGGLNGKNGNIETDFIDINGDRILDRVYKCIDGQNDNRLVVYYNDQTVSAKNPPGELKTIFYPNGGYTYYTYKPLNKQNNSKCKPGIWVVESMHKLSGMSRAELWSDDHTTTYDYKGGVYDYENREFLGFGEVTEKLPTGDYKTTKYYTDEETECDYKGTKIAKKGLLKGLKKYIGILNAYRLPVTDIYYFYEAKRFHDGVNTINEKDVKSAVFDGNSAGCILKWVSNDYEYDYDGFITRKTTINYGDVKGGKPEDTWVDIPNRYTGEPDKAKSETVFANDKVKWIIGQKMEELTYGFVLDWDLEQKEVSTYDVNDNLKMISLWDNRKGYIMKASYEYDSFGNVTRETDANISNITTTLYDPVYHGYKVSITNALGHTESIEYDRYMRKIKLTDANAVVQHIKYDDFGREIAKWGPNGDENYPDEEIEYYDWMTFNGNTVTAFPRGMKVKKRIEKYQSNVMTYHYFETVTYTDGFDRKIQVKTSTEAPSAHSDWKWTTTDTFYEDNDNLASHKVVCKETVPYQNSNSAVTSAYTVRDKTQPMTVTENWLDIREGNVTLKTKSDGSVVKTSEIKGEVSQTQRKDGRDILNVSYKDGLGNIVMIREATGAVTKYKYRTGTAKVTEIEDDKGNYTYLEYDMLGNAVRIIDPDMGVKINSYDNNSNIIQSIDQNRICIIYDYDVLNRLINEEQYNGPGNYNRFIYDDDSSQTKLPGWSGSGNRGKLVRKIAFEDGKEVSMEAVKYYDDGNIKAILRRIDDKVESSVEYKYDALGKITEVSIPGNTPEKLTYTYNINGLLKKMTGNREYVKNADYLPNGNMKAIEYGNNIVTNYRYYDNNEDGEKSSSDSLNYRLKNTFTTLNNSPVLDYSRSYIYDEIGNIKTILENNDKRSQYDQYFYYDDLNRLTLANGIYKKKAYEYDTIGNITKSDGKTYVYGDSNHIHAVTSDGMYSYKYDAVGNMIAKEFEDPINIPEGILSYGIYSLSSTQINDRAICKTLSGNYAKIGCSNGNVNIGVGAKIGDVFGRGEITLRDYSVINGDIYTETKVTRQNNVTISGKTYIKKIDDNTLPPVINTADISFEGTPQDVFMMEPDKELSLSPGKYWQVSIKSRANLYLTSGTYYFNNLEMDINSNLVLDESAGPIKIYVKNNVALGANIKHIGISEEEGAKRFFMGYLGTNTIVFGNSFSGTFVAPKASVILGQSVKVLKGMFIANNIALHQDSKFTFIPFGYFGSEKYDYSYDWKNRLSSARSKDSNGTSVIYEAEDADIGWPGLFANYYRGYTGSGYVEFFNVNATITWDVNVPTSGDYDLSFRYADISPDGRKLQITVNGVVVNNELLFPNTGSMEKWNEVGMKVSLKSGKNIIEAKAVNCTGPNMDSLKVNCRKFMKVSYDTDGRKVKSNLDGVITYYLFPEYEEVWDNNVKVESTNYYIFAGKRIARKTSGGMAYFIQDHLSSSTRIINDKNEITKIEYMPFGSVATQEGTESGAKYKYNDKEWIDSFGLYDYNARYYDPNLGRFISADTFVPGEGYDAQGLNRYTYCLNNPVIRVDPTGHDSYVFYSPGDHGFAQQAYAEKSSLENMYNTPVHMIEITSEEQFKEEWNNMGKVKDADGNVKEVDIEGVSLLFHGSPHTINIDYKNSEYLTTSPNGKTPFGSDATYIGDLESKEIDRLSILSCNGAHLDHQDDNVASSFVKNNQIRETSAWDGNVSYSKKYIVAGELTPRLSNDQKGFYNFSPNTNILGTSHRRQPMGEIIYITTQNNKIMWMPYFYYYHYNH